MKTKIAFLSFTVLTALLSGCNKPPLEAYQPQTGKDYNKPLPPGQLALRKIDPKDYPDFGRGFSDRIGLEQAIRHSIDYLNKPSSRKYYPYGEVTHDQALASLQEFLRTLNESRSPEEFNKNIADRFDVYQSVGCDDRGTVWFTGYYTPIFDGRKQRDSVFKYPLYKAPPDLVKDAEGNILGRRTKDGATTKYFTRREIEEGRLLEGTEVAWLKDPFEAYVVTVQGSAKLRLADGSLYELGYAGNNGHEYASIAKKMIDDGALNKSQLSLQAMINYFRQHPDKVYPYTWQNDRTVFFKPSSGGPFGSLGEPVTPYRSIATDKTVFPRGCLSFVNTSMWVETGGQLHEEPRASFMCDQDTGGAIRAAGRCDIYMGTGATAEALSGRMGAEGGLYYIFVKAGVQSRSPR